MKLNADILFYDLKDFFQAELSGESNPKLTLDRPRLYTEGMVFLQSDHAYVVQNDELPEGMQAEPGAVVICCGGMPSQRLARQCTCILIKDEVRVPAVLNCLQDIYNRYDEWENGLHRVLHSTADLQAIVDLSMPIFGNYISIIDRKYHVLARGQVMKDRGEEAYIHVAVEDLLEHLRQHKGSRYSEEPFFSVGEDENIRLHIDLLEEDTFLANLSVCYEQKEVTSRDTALAVYLAKWLKMALKKLNTGRKERNGILKELLWNLLNRKAVEEEQLKRFTQGEDGYICVKMQLDQQFHRISGSYVCGLIEDSAPGSVSMIFEDAVVSFIDLKQYENKSEAVLNLKEFIQITSQQAGISCVCYDLTYAWYYYRQADIALERGVRFQENGNYYYFSHYMLSYLLEKGQGEFPLEVLLTDGIRRLLRHDADSETDYIHTLRVYLNNNMNVVQTAKKLYIHRSTLMTRLKRIHMLLLMDLEDPDQRLLLQILLKSLEKRTGEKKIIHT